MRLDPPPDYQPYYCEENAWRLAQRLAAQGHAPELVILTNAQRQVLVFAQRAAGAAPYVVWDYHAVVRFAGQVWDLDCTAGCPLPTAAWVSACFPYPPDRWPEYAPVFRVAPWAEAATAFTTDRRHMRGPDGGWLQPPPPWAPPTRPDAPHTLPDWLRTQGDGPGRLCTLAEFCAG